MTIAKDSNIHLALRNLERMLSRFELSFDLFSYFSRLVFSACNWCRDLSFSEGVKGKVKERSGTNTLGIAVSI